MKDISSLAALLQSPKNIVITMHMRPDGDALGSSMGLYHFLTLQGHRVHVISPTDIPDYLSWLAVEGVTYDGSAYPEEAKKHFMAAELIFCLDFNDLHRLGQFEEDVQAAGGTKIMVDHHESPTGFDDLRFWDHHASSTAEMIYRIISELGAVKHLNVAAGTALYTGMMTDTGSFRYPNTSPAVHRIVAHLMEIGVKTSTVHEQLFSQESEKRLRLLGHVLNNRLTVLREYGTAYIALNKKDVTDFQIGTGDTEGFVNYALSLKGINLAIFLVEKDDLIKMSFRSIGEVSAVDMARMFNGGGHFHAAGGRSTESLNDTETKLFAAIQKSNGGRNF
ncbi:MAG: DHH family phosphoesterase [Bacteroidota bacterium]